MTAQEPSRRAPASNKLLNVLLLAIASAQSLPASADALPAFMTDDSSFAWKDEHGMSTTFSQWRGKTILLTMAYSTCRQVCSYTLHRLDELQQSADRAGTAIEVVVVSYDPAVDGPGSWSIYRKHHHLNRANWHFLTGNPDGTQRFADALHFRYWRYDDHLVHDFKILLLGPDGRIARTLDWAERDEELFAATARRCPPTDTQGCKQ